MSTKTFKIIYYAVTGLLSVMMVMSAFMYFTNTEEVGNSFVSLGYPATLVVPLGIAKLLGLVAIWTRRSSLLKELAYLGFAINFTLALFAHISAQDGDFIAPIIALVLLAASYFLDKKAFPKG